MNNLKESGENTSSASNDATDASTWVNNSAVGAINRSICVYIYGVCVVFVLALVVCVFFVYNKKSCETANKNQLKELPIKPLNWRSMC